MRPITADDDPNIREVRKRARLLLERLTIRDPDTDPPIALRWRTDTSTGRMWTYIHTEPNTRLPFKPERIRTP